MPFDIDEAVTNKLENYTNEGLPIDDAPQTLSTYEESANTTPPVVAYITVSTSIAPGDLIEVDVTDDQATSHVHIIASYSGGAYKEVVYDGTVFGPLYTSSTAGTISGGTKFILRHDNDWYDDVTIQIFAEDNFGNTVDGPRSFLVSGAGVPTLVQVGDPPVVDYVTAAGVVLAANTITVDVTDDNSLSHVVIIADYGTLQEIVYDGTSFGVTYNAASTITPISGGDRYVLAHDTGWSKDMSIRVIALDDGAQVTTTSTAYTVPDGPGLPVIGPPQDVVKPVIDNVSPSSLTNLLPVDPVSFHITDGSGSLLVVFISVLFPATGEQEVIYTGDKFSPRYKSLSSKISITDGDAWSIRRVSGWPSAPTIEIKTFDLGGNEGKLVIT